MLSAASQNFGRRRLFESVLSMSFSALLISHLYSIFISVPVGVRQISNDKTMRSTLLLLVCGVVFLFVGNTVNAWGGIYTNRFSPEMLQNLGYGAPRSYQPEVSDQQFATCRFAFFYGKLDSLCMLILFTNGLFVPIEN